MTLLPLMAMLLASPSDALWVRYQADGARRLVPLVSAAVRFETLEGRADAWDGFHRWLDATATGFGLSVRRRDAVTEVELAGPPGAPVLGLVVHADVVPADPRGWRTPPFEATRSAGRLVGRGVVDDKAPLVQALLAMKTLRDEGIALTHSVRLLVGTNEETSSTDMGEYLREHAAPAYTLVLDAVFPVAVGELAWNSLGVSSPFAERDPRGLPYAVAALDAGTAVSIVPHRARLTLAWRDGAPSWSSLVRRLRARPMPDGTRLYVRTDGRELHVEVHGRAAHAGMNPGGGRNALVALAALTRGLLPGGAADDLLGLAYACAHDDLLALPAGPAPWGSSLVNPGTVAVADGRAVLSVGIRTTPRLHGQALEAHVLERVRDFAARRPGARLEASGTFEDAPLEIPPEAKLVRRLLAAYARATGAPAQPVVIGGGTYAKRIPDSVVFGMWFPGAPYTGHDVDEAVPVDDLHRGVRVLLEALADLATGPRLEDPLRP